MERHITEITTPPAWAIRLGESTTHPSAAALKVAAALVDSIQGVSHVVLRHDLWKYSLLTGRASRSDSGREATVVAKRHGVVWYHFRNLPRHPTEGSATSVASFFPVF